MMPAAANPSAHNPASGPEVATGYRLHTGPGGAPGAKPSGDSSSGAGLGLGGAATLAHVHSIYRDPSNEYGAKWTGQ